MRCPVLVLPVLLLPFAGACSKPADESLSESQRPKVTLAGTLRDEALVEASGLARSKRVDGVLWVINDGGSAPSLHAIDHSGGSRGRLDLDNADNLDWEDLASFELDGKPYLLAADIGDNDAKRDHLTLYIVEEPIVMEHIVVEHIVEERIVEKPIVDEPVAAEPVPGRINGNGAQDYAWRIRFRYPGGPRDAESVAVDTAGETVLVLSKRDLPPVLYSVPLRPPVSGADGIVTATRLGPVTSLPSPDKSDVENAPVTKDWHWQPTALDIWPDGTSAAILTYRAVYVYERATGQSWPAALKAEPRQVVGLGNIPNAEAVAFGDTADTLFVTIENRRPPLIRIDTSGEFPQ